ncbi:M48 family metallopeptidase [Tolypothrix campylonemoides VB511288]|nr:M48 family metallopeptidase [Tolypothrix campylonemoides VB511288]
MTLRRPAVRCLALALALAAVPLSAQEAALPDIGSSANELITPSQQQEYGRMLVAQLRQYGYLLDDPLIDGWLDTVGARLGAHSDRPRQSFTFFMLKDRDINAFATLGGHIGMNTGLVLAADREDQVAGVLAHEISHVTQDHVIRGVERAQKDQLPILLGMLAAVAAASASDSSSSDDATQAAIASAYGLMAQRQINYTRSNESEADRIGIQTLARAGYDTAGMAEFFEKMLVASRTNRGSDPLYQTPDYLLTHPVTTLRISEARQRAEQIARSGVAFTGDLGGSDNPLLPAGVRLDGAGAGGATGVFDYARERLRVLSAETPRAALAEYERMARAKPLTPAQRYGQALATMRANQPGAAADTLQALLAGQPRNRWITLALAEAEAKAGRPQAFERFDALLAQAPTDRAVALTYAAVLNERGTADAGRRAQAVLRPLQGRVAEDVVFQRSFARAAELAGDPIRAGEAYAEAAFLGGRPELALVQLNNLKKRDDLDYYARARIEARIAAITPTVLELRRQGIRDEDLRRR